MRCHGQVLSVAEDARHQPGQDGARTDLDEHSCAVAVHRLDLANELDRAQEMFSQHGCDHRRVVRVSVAGGVGEHRDTRRRQWRLLEHRDEPSPRRLYVR